MTAQERVLDDEARAAAAAIGPHEGCSAYEVGRRLGKPVWEALLRANRLGLVTCETVPGTAGAALIWKRKAAP